MVNHTTLVQRASHPWQGESTAMTPTARFIVVNSARDYPRCRNGLSTGVVEWTRPVYCYPVLAPYSGQGDPTAAKYAGSRSGTL